MQGIRHPPKSDDSVLVANAMIDKYVSKVVEAIEQASDPNFGVQEASLQRLY